VRGELARNKKKPDSIKDPAPTPVRGFSFPASISSETMFPNHTTMQKKSSGNAPRNASACMVFVPPHPADAS
jgi:hypothetical protein